MNYIRGEEETEQTIMKTIKISVNTFTPKCDLTLYMQNTHLILV